MERKALGKGIGALIPEKELEKEERVVSLPINQIKANPFQPRENFDQEKLEELIRSIKEKGVIQPVLVRRKADAYELIAGERRWRAAKVLNLNEIPAIIKDVADLDSLEISLIENVQRQNLNPIEEARAFQYLADKYEITQEKMSEVLGKSRESISNTLRLLKLPQEIQEEIIKGRISFAHGRALLEIEDANEQRRLAYEIIAKGLSVRELENIIKTRRPRISRPRAKSTRAADAYLAVLEEELQHRLATKVRIFQRKKRGTIIIEFYSTDDLKRIVTLLRGEEKL
ncbi:MAG: ParB/RepB/Spo0J family partition protein [Candidatus Omnitrophica bacterium]|nr:ParB/RepB/Spo0J family partition protein [Candidatus Omnitrophota bacterium]